MKKIKILKRVHDLKFLRDLYKRESLDTRHGYNTLANYVRWFELNPHLECITVYVINDTWRESGFFIIEDQYQLFMNCVTYNEEEITAGLMSLNWNSRRYKITALPVILIDIVEKTLRGLSVNYRMATLRTYERDENSIMQNRMNCPADFEIRSLNVTDAVTINDLWYSRQEGSLHFLESLIKYNISLGIYCRDSNELIAWCTRCPCGFMGTLHVREKYRRHGLASLLIDEFSQRLAAQGEAVRVMINEMNRMSTNLFTKFHFRFHEKVFILFCEPRDT